MSKRCQGLPVEKDRFSVPTADVPEMEVPEVTVLLTDLADEVVQCARSVLEGAEGLHDPTVEQLNRR